MSGSPGLHGVLGSYRFTATKTATRPGTRGLKRALLKRPGQLYRRRNGMTGSTRCSSVPPSATPAIRPRCPSPWHSRHSVRFARYRSASGAQAPT